MARCTTRRFYGRLSDNAGLVSLSPLDVDQLICAALRGDKPSWPGDAHPSTTGELLLRRATFHGVASLLHARLGVTKWPAAVLERLREVALEHAMWEMRHQQVLAGTLAALESFGIQPILLKGTALAYSIYFDPAVRTRGDTDLLIRIDARDRVHQALVSLGYQVSNQVSGEFISYQANYVQLSPEGYSHTLDVHWKINNSEVLSRLFTFDEIHKDAQPLPRLSPQAIGSSRVHALLIACMHRCTHRTNPYYVEGRPYLTDSRLIWLYDIHLLAASMNEHEWIECMRMAERKQLRAVCIDGLQASAKSFGTALPQVVLAAIDISESPEPASRYFASSKLRQQWMDFQALGSKRNQLRFAVELAFPPAAYMRLRYPGGSRTWLPWLYVRRTASGIVRRVFRARSSQ